MLKVIYMNFSNVLISLIVLASNITPGAEPPRHRPFAIAMRAAEENRREIAEYGRTTRRRRRKATGISWPHLQEAIMLNGPTQIALAFCNHLGALPEHAALSMS